MADITIPELDPLSNIPDDAILYVIVDGQDYKTTKGEFLAGNSPVIYKNTTPILHTGTTAETRVLLVDLGLGIDENTILKIEDIFLNQEPPYDLGGITVRLYISDTSTMPSSANNLIATIDGMVRYGKAQRSFKFEGFNDVFYFLYGYHNEIPTYSDVTSIFREKTNPLGILESRKYLHVTVQLSHSSQNFWLRSMLIKKY